MVSQKSWNKIWVTIHIIGATFNSNCKDSVDSFGCFFRNLRDLLPCPTASKNLDQFIKNNPPEKYTKSKEDSFKWTWSLHSMINLIKRREGYTTQDLTLEKAMVIYSKENIKLNTWSHAFWFLIHYLAANLPKQLDEIKMIAFKSFIVCIMYLLPCDNCKQHMMEYLTYTSIDNNLQTRDSLFIWTCNFHNSVNKRLGKPIVEPNSIIKNYFEVGSKYTMIEDF